MSPNLCDVSALQQVSKTFCSMGYVTNQNQEKSLQSVSRWIFAYSYFAFDNVFLIKNAGKIKKTLKTLRVLHL